MQTNLSSQQQDALSFKKTSQSPHFEVENAIVAALASRDERRRDWALTVLYQNSTFRQCVNRLTSCPDEAEEVHRYAVFKLSEKIIQQHYQPTRGSIWAYMLGIARRHVYSRRRSAERELRRREKFIEKSVEYANYQHQKVAREQVLRQLAPHLKGNFQKILMLLADGHTPDEIQTILNYSSIGITRVRISECRAQVRFFLAQHPDFCIQ